MSDLIMKAEQGVLGALLAAHERSDQALIFEHLAADDFGHPAHRAVFSALADLAVADHTGERLATAIAVIGERDDIDIAWLTSLAADAPSEAHTRAYIKIVLAAAFDRDSAGFAAPYLAAAELEVDPEAQASLVRTGHSLQVQAEVFAASSIIDPDRPVVITTIVADRELTREERVIADLLQHPEQAPKVAAWLDSQVFTTEQRRHAYEITISHAYHGDPIDPVIVGWELERAREIDRYHQQQTWPGDRQPERDYPYVARLAATPVVAGTAIVVGHELLSEHVSATLTLSATAAAQRQTAATAAALQHPPLEVPLSVNPVVDRRIEL